MHEPQFDASHFLVASGESNRLRDAHAVSGQNPQAPPTRSRRRPQPTITAPAEPLTLPPFRRVLYTNPVIRFSTAQRHVL